MARSYARKAPKTHDTRAFPNLASFGLALATVILLWSGPSFSCEMSNAQLMKPYKVMSQDGLRWVCWKTPPDCWLGLKVDMRSQQPQTWTAADTAICNPQYQCGGACHG